MRRTERFIITGGSGFIGSHFIRYLSKIRGNVEIFNLDSLTYAADNKRLADISKKGYYHFIKIDIRGRKRLSKIIDEIKPAAVFHFAAETHVDNSIRDPSNFISTNIEGTYHLLESLKDRDTRLIHISTDEIYGDRAIKGPYFTEESNYSPSSPYSASKASQEMLIKAFIRTYGLNAIILRLCNNYGPFQHREKFVPTCIINAIKNEPIPIYGDGRNMREWIFVKDTARAIYIAFENFQQGTILNIGSGDILSNLEIARLILKLTGRDQSLIRFVDDRPGHDIAYGIDTHKIKKLGFKTQIDLSDGLKMTINWFRKNINTT